MVEIEEDDDGDGRPVIVNYESVNIESGTDMSRAITLTQSVSSSCTEKKAQSLHPNMKQSQSISKPRVSLDLEVDTATTILQNAKIVSEIRPKENEFEEIRFET